MINFSRRNLIMLSRPTGTHALKVLHILTAEALSHLRTEHGHRMNTTKLDTCIACSHTLAAVTDTEEMRDGNSSTEMEPDCSVV